MDCNGAGSKKGEAMIDLRGTPYAVDDKWEHTGVDSAGTWEFSDKNQVVKIRGGGNCGMAAPRRAVEQGTCGPAGGWHLKLKRIVEEVWQRSLFVLFENNPTKLTGVCRRSLNPLPHPDGAQVPACSQPCQGFTSSCQQPAADQCTCTKGLEGQFCSADLTKTPTTVYFDPETLVETRRIYKQYRTGMPAELIFEPRRRLYACFGILRVVGAISCSRQWRF
jgi:hypothetical protein